VSDGYDVKILGGGPAGTCCALRLKQWGLRVALAPGNPRPHPLPEETLVDSARPLLEEWDLLDVVTERWPGTPRHAVVWGDDELRWRAGVDASPGYKVHRPELDGLLLRRAVDAGVTLADDASARITVLATGKLHPGGASPVITVDARPQTVALYGFVTEPDAWDDTTVVEAVAEGWWWWLPLRDGRASLALLADAEEVAARGRDAVIRSACATARGPAARFQPDRWRGMIAQARLRTAPLPFLLTGDAASTIDPLSSQGVEKALASAEETAYVVNTMLQDNDAWAELQRHHRAWERSLFNAHDERARSLYQREARFGDAPFWRKRGAATPPPRSDELLPRRVGPAPSLGPATSWARRGQSLTPERAWTLGDALPLARIGDVPLGPLLDLIGDGASPDDVVRGASRVPELFLSTPGRVRGALERLLQRGWLVPR